MNAVEAELRSLLMHDRFVRGVAAGLVSDPSSVDDIVQETWWAAIRRRAASRQPLLPWLAKVSRHFALNARRGEARRHARERIAAVPEEIPSTAALIEREAVRKGVVEAVLGLPEPLKTTIVLRYFEGLPPRAIARRAGVPVETVRSRLKRSFSLLLASLAGLDCVAFVSFGPVMFALAHGPRAPIGASAAGVGKAVGVGTLAMSTGTKVATAVAAVLVVVGLAVIPSLVTSGDRRAPDASVTSPPPQAPGPTARATPTDLLRPRPFSESDPESNEVRIVNTLELEVLGPAGRPASNARLVLHRGEDVLARATTDAEGRADFPPREGEAEIVVLPDGAPVHAETIGLAAGRRRIQLPPGASIKGRAQLDGDRPPHPVTLTFHPLRDDLRLAGLVEALDGVMSPTCTTGPSGEFEFTGLREGSEWRIGPAPGTSEWRLGTTSGYRVASIARDGRAAIVIPAPADDVVVELRRLPIVRGRVVSGARHLPVPNAGITVTLHGPGNTRMAGLHPREDGRFSFVAEEASPEDEVTRLQIEVGGPGGIGRREFTLDPAPERDHDLGDIELPEGTTIRYVVRDPQGNPIEGAFARVQLEADAASRTDSAGRGSIVVSPEVRMFRVGALRHEVVEVAIPSPVPELLPVVLRPNAGLTVRVVTQPAAAVSFTSVQIRAGNGSPGNDPTGQFFRAVGSGVIGNDGTYVAAGATRNAGGFLMESLASFDFLPVEGRVVVAGLKPAIPFKVTVLDRLGAALASTAVTLAPGEWKTVDLEVSKPARTLRSRVLDPARRPVPDARVTIDAEREETGASGRFGSGAIAGTSDATGRVVLDGIFGSSVHLAVVKDGFVRVVRRDFELPPEGAEVEVMLQKGCVLTVSLVDARGAPIAEQRIAARVEGYPRLDAVEKQPGEYVFSDFPLDVTATIEFDWAARSWSRTIGVKADHVERIQMPATGALVVDYSALGGPSERGLDLRVDWPGKEPNSLDRRIQVPPPGSPRTYEISPMIPGEYTVTLSFDPGSPGRPPRPVSEPVRITAGETTRVVFRKP